MKLTAAQEAYYKKMLGEMEGSDREVVRIHASNIASSMLELAIANGLIKDNYIKPMNKED